MLVYVIVKVSYIVYVMLMYAIHLPRTKIIKIYIITISISGLYQKIGFWGKGD